MESKQAVQIAEAKAVPLKRKRASGSSDTLLIFLLPAAILVVWQLITGLKLIPSYQLPSPLDVVGTLFQFLLDGSLLSNLSVTTGRVFFGILAGTTAALLLGSAVGVYRKAEKTFDPVIQALKSIPGLAWVPLFILWMGIGELSKVTLIATGVFFPVYLNIVSGILNVDRKLIEVGKIYQFSRMKMVKKIIFPATLPFFFTGLRSGVGIGWMFVVASELMGASQGLGYLLVIGQNSSSPNIIIASIVMFALMGKLSDMLIKAIEKRALKWRDDSAIGG